MQRIRTRTGVRSSTNTYTRAQFCTSGVSLKKKESKCSYKCIIVLCSISSNARGAGVRVTMSYG